MNRINDTFKKLKKSKRKAFIAYITAGDPDLKITEELIISFEKSGVDIIELGVAFSDPMADGLTNQKAAERALAGGTTLHDIIALVRNIRHKTNVPIVLFTYLNPVFRYGILKFAEDASRAGVDGILILDLPAEESGEYKKILNSEGIELIYLVAPTSTEKRIKMISGKAGGFLYYVSRTGVTGEKENIESAVKPMVEKIKKLTKVPVVVGFGISRPEHVKEISRYADGIVVGSAIVKEIENNLGKADLIQKVNSFIASLTQVL